MITAQNLTKRFGDKVAVDQLRAALLSEGRCSGAERDLSHCPGPGGGRRTTVPRSPARRCRRRAQASEPGRQRSSSIGLPSLNALRRGAAERVRALLAADASVTEKKMFGGLAFLVGGNMAVAASGQGILVRSIRPSRTGWSIPPPPSWPSCAGTRCRDGCGSTGSRPHQATAREVVPSGSAFAGPCPTSPRRRSPGTDGARCRRSRPLLGHPSAPHPVRRAARRRRGRRFLGDLAVGT